MVSITKHIALDLTSPASIKSIPELHSSLLFNITNTRTFNLHMRSTPIYLGGLSVHLSVVEISLCYSLDSFIAHSEHIKNEPLNIIIACLDSSRIS